MFRGIDESAELPGLIQKRIWFRSGYRRREMMFVLTHAEFKDNTEKETVSQSMELNSLFLKLYKVKENREKLKNFFNKHAGVDVVYEMYPYEETDENHICYLKGYEIRYYKPEELKEKLSEMINKK